MTETGEVTNRPGTALIKIGLVLAVVGVLFTIAVVSAGGNLVPLWLVLAGLVLAGIGFGMRVLAALERR
jgi:protein-S-isoprenylcysteine O-methyltransferase Ste14